MKTIIYLVRHTETIGNVEKRLTGREDYDVTKKGYESIKALTRKLENVKFDKAYSSTSKRTQKTIELLANKNHLTVETSDDFCEMYFGIYDGWKWEDVNRVNPKIYQTHLKTNEISGIPNQESTSEVANRVYKKINSICEENSGKTILIASHGVAIEAFLRKISKEPFTEKVDEYSQRNTSINIVEYDSEEKEFTIKLLNNYEHLKILEKM